MVQILMGDHPRSSLLWHLDGESEVAVDPCLEQWPTAIEVSTYFGTENLEPLFTKITGADAREALRHFLETGRRASALAWEPVPGD